MKLKQLFTAHLCSDNQLMQLGWKIYNPPKTTSKEDTQRKRDNFHV